MKIFVIDLMNLARRAYHGFSRSSDGLLATSSGKFTYVCYGVALSFNKLLSDYSPDSIIVCTDSKGKTFRHEMYSLYKSNRKGTDDDFNAQLPDLFKMIELYGFPILRREATEADDLIGSVVKKWAGKDTASGTASVTIVSGDKDYMQLVGPHCNILKPENMGAYKWVKEQEVFEKFGVAPSQVIDALSIIGDAADVVPGVAGIGEKGAAELLQAYGTLENLYANVHNLKPKYRDKLIKSMVEAFMSKKLVTIDCDMPIELDLEASRVRENTLQDPELRKWFGEMEFRTFLFEGAEVVGESGDGYFSERGDDTTL